MLVATQIPSGLSFVDNALKLALKPAKPNPSPLNLAEVKFIPLDEMKLLRAVKDGLLSGRSSCLKMRANGYRESARTLFRWAKRWKNNELPPPAHCHRLMENALADVHLDNETGYLAGSLVRIGTYYGMFAGGTARSLRAKLDSLNLDKLPLKSRERIEDLKKDTERYF